MASCSLYFPWRRWRLALLTCCGVVLVSACSNDHEADADAHATESYQQSYQPLAASIEIKSFESPNGKTLQYIDEGSSEGQPLLLVSGFGTSITAALLTSHLAQLRDQLDIRLISLQRNGLGEQAYSAGWSYQDYVTEVDALLAALGIDDFHLFAISGGGPYAAFLAQALGQRVQSLHLAATITGNNLIGGQSTLPGSLRILCDIAEGPTPLENVRQLLGSFALQSAQSWWGFSPENPMLALSGFEQAAALDWEYTFYSGDSEQALTALAAEAIRYCELSLPDLSGITAPVFIYRGAEDQSSPANNIDAWLASLSNASATTVRLYPAEGHWVQYSHLEQVYVDITRPGFMFVCDEDGNSNLVPELEGESLVQDFNATPGLCRPWQ